MNKIGHSHNPDVLGTVKKTLNQCLDRAYRHKMNVALTIKHCTSQQFSKSRKNRTTWYLNYYRKLSFLSCSLLLIVRTELLCTLHARRQSACQMKAMESTTISLIAPAKTVLCCQIIHYNVSHSSFRRSFTGAHFSVTAADRHVTVAAVWVTWPCHVTAH